MDTSTLDQVRSLTRTMRSARASEVAFLDAAVEALQIAIGNRDWEAVVEVSATMSRLALDLSQIGGQAS